MARSATTHQSIPNTKAERSATFSPTRGMIAPCRENGTSLAPRPKKAASKSSAVVATTRCRCAPSNSCSATATILSSSSRHSSIPTTSAKSPAISHCRKAPCRNRPLWKNAQICPQTSPFHLIHQTSCRCCGRPTAASIPPLNTLKTTGDGSDFTTIAVRKSRC